MSQNRALSRPVSMILTLLTAAVLAACGGANGGLDSAAPSASMEVSFAATSTAALADPAGSAAMDAGVVSTPGQLEAALRVRTVGATSSGVLLTGSTLIALAPASAPLPLPAQTVDLASVTRSSTAWTQIAVEGGPLVVSGLRTVRYGTGSSWVEKGVTGIGRHKIPLCRGKMCLIGLISFYKKCDIPKVVELYQRRSIHPRIWE